MKCALVILAILVVNAHASLDLADLSADIDKLSVEMEQAPSVPQQMKMCRTCNFCSQQCSQKEAVCLSGCSFQSNSAQCTSGCFMQQQSCLNGWTSYCPYERAPAPIIVATRPDRTAHLQEAQSEPQQSADVLCFQCPVCQQYCFGVWQICDAKCQSAPNEQLCKSQCVHGWHFCNQQHQSVWAPHFPYGRNC